MAIVRRVQANGGSLSTMCAGTMTLRKAGMKLPDRAGQPVGYDQEQRIANSLGPGVSIEAACLLVRELVTPEEYRTFRKYNSWLFGGKDQFPPRRNSLQ